MEVHKQSREVYLVNVDQVALIAFEALKDLLILPVWGIPVFISFSWGVAIEEKIVAFYLFFILFLQFSDYIIQAYKNGTFHMVRGI